MILIKNNNKLISCFLALVTLLISYNFSPNTANSQAASDYGSGPISLSPAVTRYYKEKYLKEENPELFFVNKSGTWASYLVCSHMFCRPDYSH